jgi:hypothetical protein
MKRWIAEGCFVTGKELADLGAAEIVDFHPI